MLMLADKIILKYKGKKQSARAWSLELGIPVQRIIDRYNKEWTVSKILSKDKELKKEPIFIEYKGKKVALDKLSKKLDINYNTLYLRYKNGFVGDKLVAKENLPNNVPSILITHNGQTLSVAEWSKKLNLKKRTIMDRFHKGLPTDKILEKIKPRTKNQPSQFSIRFNGKEKTIKEWAKELGLKEGTIYSRYKKGLPVEQILSINDLPTSISKLPDKTDFYIALHKEYLNNKSILQLSKDHKVSQNTIRKMFKNLNLETRSMEDSIKIGAQQNKTVKYAKEVEKINKRLSEMDYVFADDYRGQDIRDALGNYIERIKYKIKHSVCNNVFLDDVYAMPRCPHCFGSIQVSSYQEDILCKFLTDNNIPFEKNVRILRNPNNPRSVQEIDIFIPSLNIGFEVDSLKWHHSNKDKHSNKTEWALQQGIKLYHIWTFFDKEKVKAFILNKLGKNQRIYASKTLFKEISPSESKEFLDNNHMHNAVKAKYHFGLFHNEELVSVISYREHSEGIEIARYAGKQNISVVGGFSKLLKNSIKVLKDKNYKKIITYADRDLTPDYKESVYYKNGFTFIGNTGNILFYTDQHKPYPRQIFQKHKLSKLLKVYDPSVTADENLIQNHIYPVWNSGNWKFELKIS